MRVSKGFALMLLPLALALAPSSARAEDTQPPQITHTPVTAIQKGHPVSVKAKITDESKFFPQVFYKWDGASAFEKPIDMKPMKSKKNKDWFEATVPAKGSASLEYYIEAYDEFGNGPARSGSPDAPHKVDVPAPAEPPAVAVTEEKSPEAAAEPPKAQQKPAEAAAAPPASGAEKSDEAPPAPKRPKKIAAAETAPDMEPSSPPGPSGGQRPRTWTWVVGGTGVGLLVGGALTGLAFKKADDAYTARVNDPKGSNSSTLQQQYDATKSIGTMSTVMLVGGLALVGGGVALYFLENPEKSSGKRADASPADGRLQFAAAPVQGGAAAVLAGSF